MAIEIKFQGFINEVKQFDWGTVYDIAHNQVRKDAQGNWETVGKDYFSVVAEPGYGKGDKVEVVGRMKTKLYDKKDGSKGVSLQVRAESINILRKGNSSFDGPTTPEVQAIWPDVKQIPDDNAPF